MDPQKETINKDTIKDRTLYDKEYWKKYLSWTFNNI